MPPLHADPAVPPAPVRRIALAFFLSGVAALIDQIVWQRLLHVIVGTDIESVTIVVATFMLGLGLGAALGGWWADRFPRHVIAAFCAVEAGIGLYGWFSADLLLASAERFATLGRAEAAALSFLLLLLPTVAMGATLPMLIADAARRNGNVGVSTGTLYFINTLGAATGALAVGFVLLHWWDLRETLRGAALLNLTACLLIAHAVRSTARRARRAAA